MSLQLNVLNACFIRSKSNDWDECQILAYKSISGRDAKFKVDMSRRIFGMDFHSNSDAKNGIAFGSKCQIWHVKK